MNAAKAQIIKKERREASLGRSAGKIQDQKCQSAVGKEERVARSAARAISEKNASSHLK